MPDDRPPPILSGEPTARDCARHTARFAEIMRDFLGKKISDEIAMEELDKIILQSTRHIRKEDSK